MQTGPVFNIQKYSIHDGPGIRTTVFLKGCPLCCSWCHNPEGQSPERELLTVETRCIACGECRRACRFAESVEGDGPLPPNVEECLLCGECVAACPTDARQIVGREMSVPEVMAEIVQDGVFYDDSSGGVTFSGGEPLMQPEFLKALLQACRGRGIHTAVDTCGFACTDRLLEVAQLTDLILFDLKLMDDAKHRRYTGVSNAPIFANLRALDQVHDNIWVRVPLVPGINDDEDNLNAVARFAASIGGVTQVSLLPYHKTAGQKFRRLGRVFPLEGVEAPSAEQVDLAVNRFRSVGLTVMAGA
jgi:pyruvate formate lyase activating enzyme